LVLDMTLLASRCRTQNKLPARTR